MEHLFKKSILLYAVLCLFLGWSSPLAAQVVAPDFLCVKGDTLFWNPATNNCGPFVSVQVYSAMDINGPFSLLTSITNPNQDFYFDSNPTAQDRFYYLQANHNCPGVPVLSSDTLDNRIPTIPEILTISVDNDNVEITWLPGADPEVIGYIIYRTTPLGAVPIDTVFGNNAFVDTGANPSQQSESYFVLALDGCGNTSLFDAAQSTLYLEATIEPCAQTAFLTWNINEAWDAVRNRHEIWVIENGGLPTLVDTIAANLSTYALTGLQKNIDYEVFVRAVGQPYANEVFSASNKVTWTVDVVQALREICWLDVSYDNNNVLELAWAWDNTAELKTYALRSSLDNRVLVELFNNPVLTPQVQVTDTNRPINSFVGTYQVHTLDQCDTILLSVEVKTMVLEVATTADYNQLNWSAIGIPSLEGQPMRVFRQIGNGTPTVIATESGFSYQDFFDKDNAEAVNACYWIEVAGSVTPASGGASKTVTQRSNFACGEATPVIFMPNAFAPRGINTEFKPVVRFGQNTAYEMRIYDRFGKEVFMTANLKEGWNGRLTDVRDAPSGIYAYTVKVVTPNGIEVSTKGTLTLIR